jgi:SEC-C motif/Protein of unknown function (DUF1186)
MPQNSGQFPSLHHPELSALSTFGPDIPSETLDALLALPTETLLADLEALLRNSIAIEEFDDEDWYGFNAFMLVGHIGSPQSLPLILEVLSMSSEKLDCLFGDYLTEDIWQVPMLCGLQQVDQLVDFVKNEFIESMFARCAVLDAIEQIAYWYPERKPEIAGHITEILQHFDNWDEDSFDDDTYVVACTVDAAANLQITDCLPIIQSLYEKDSVDTFLRGGWEHFQKNWDKRSDGKKDLFPDIRDWYKLNGLAWTKSMQDAEEFAEKKRLQQELDAAEKAFEKAKQAHDATKKELQNNLTTLHEQKTGEKKIGRNDPCPCGSGKKYKKCHG